MALNFADDTSVLTETKPSDNSTDTDSGIDAQFDELLEGGETTPTDDADSQSEPVEPSTDEETVEEPQTVEGPSYAMKTVARQAGIPERLVESALTDAQLHQWVTMAGERAEPGPEPTPEFKVELPEDEYDENDSVRKQFNSMQSHYTEQIESLKENMAAVVGLVKGFETEQRNQVEQQQSSTQARFDAVLDKRELPILGKFGELSRANTKIRGAIYDELAEVTNTNPTATYEEQVDIALSKAIPGFTDTNKASRQRQSIQQQSRSRLGSGNSRPAPEANETVDKKFDDFIKALDVKNAR